MSQFLGDWVLLEKGIILQRLERSLGFFFCLFRYSSTAEDWAHCLEISPWWKNTAQPGTTPLHIYIYAKNNHDYITTR
jgi:hypothetical protein